MTKITAFDHAKTFIWKNAFQNQSRHFSLSLSALLLVERSCLLPRGRPSTHIKSRFVRYVSLADGSEELSDFCYYKGRIFFSFTQVMESTSNEVKFFFLI